MGKENTTFGSIHISPNAVATIAYRATLESYGVVGLAPRNLAEGLAHSLTQEPTRGISVRFDGEMIDIDIHVIIEYGTRVTSVANSVANTVRFHVEKALGLKVNASQRARGGFAGQQSGLVSADPEDLVELITTKSEKWTFKVLNLRSIL